MKAKIVYGNKNFSWATEFVENEIIFGDLKNKEYIILLGRRRWKIENKVLKEEKSDILNIKHIYIKNAKILKIFI